MKIVILTSSPEGSAAYYMPYLAEHQHCEVVSVILNRRQSINRTKRYKQKLKKTVKIGPFGALIGLRMRKWYNEDLKNYLAIEDVRHLCERYEIALYETPTINCKRTAQLFHQAEADVGLSLGNGYISEEVFNIPVNAMINIHHEILPDYQNAQSVIWQLYNRSTYTGYTIHKIDKNIDEGEIILKESMPIRFKESLSDTVTNTLALLWKRSAKGLLYFLDNFETLFSAAAPQHKGCSYTTPTLRQFIRIYSNFRELKER